MKKILAILLLVACSEDGGPVFKIDGGVFLESRFENFVGVSETFDVTIPRDNMLLKFSEDENSDVNDSRAYHKGDQLVIEIDQPFLDNHAREENLVTMIVYQQLANGLLGTAFRDCGIMKHVNVPTDLIDRSWSYNDWANLFDPSSPCL